MCTPGSLRWQIAGAVFPYNSIMMIGRWLPYALLCSIFLATADFFVKLASTKISASMGMFIYGATTFVFGLAWVSSLKITGQPLLVTRTGLLYSFAGRVGVQPGNNAVVPYLRTS